MNHKEMLTLAKQKGLKPRFGIRKVELEQLLALGPVVKSPPGPMELPVDSPSLPEDIAEALTPRKMNTGGETAAYEEAKPVLVRAMGPNGPEGEPYTAVGSYEVPEAPVVAPRPLGVHLERFNAMFNELEPGRGYTLEELGELAGFKVTPGDFDDAVSKDIAFAKSGGRWVRRPKDLGMNQL